MSPPEASVLEPQAITCWLQGWREGDAVARNKVFEALYKQLLGIAMKRFGRQGSETLQPAALVNELWLRLDGTDAAYSNRAHFLAVASLKMHAVVVDHYRAVAAVKRGRDYGEQVGLTMAVELDADNTRDVDAMAVQQALEKLTRVDARAACVVQLSYFAGMRREEIASLVEVSVPTVDRDLRFAKAWLNRFLE